MIAIDTLSDSENEKDEEEPGGLAGRIIASKRALSEMKSYELAEELGITPSYLSMIERNKRSISLDLVSKISVIFDFSDQEISTLLKQAKYFEQSKKHLELDKYCGTSRNKVKLLFKIAEAISEMSESETMSVLAQKPLLLRVVESEAAKRNKILQ